MILTDAIQRVRDFWAGLDTMPLRPQSFPDLPDTFVSLRPGQEQAIEEILAAYQSGAHIVFLEAPTGCLAGSTKIGINRGGKGFTLPIAEVVARFNGAGTLTRNPKVRRTTAAWAHSIPTYVQASDGSALRLRPLLAAVESGKRFTYTLMTDRGRDIRATADHPFMTDTGWVPLGLLRPGQAVHVLGTRGGRARGVKRWYRQIGGIPAHPYHGRRGVRSGKGGFSVPLHRLVVEAHLNGLSYDKFLRRLRDEETQELSFLDPRMWHVHHKDENPLNNDLSNLEIKSGVDHLRLHGEEGGWRNVAHPIVREIVVGVVPFGVESTYDLTLGEPHNFIASGFVVHNSGKTLIAEIVRRRLLATAMYLCSTRTLQQQFHRDFPYSEVIMGRVNYPTLDDPRRFEPSLGAEALTCADCTQGEVSPKGCGVFVEESGKPGCPSMPKSLHCYFCFPTGTPVVVWQGLRPIETINEGDRVLTTAGTFARVLKTMSRRHIGTLYEVHTAGAPPWRATGEHPIWASRAATEAPRWIPASDLDPGDFVWGPIPLESGALVEVLRAAWLGDGETLTPKSTHSQYDTTSLTLAHQLQTLLLRRGIVPSFRVRPARPGHAESYRLSVSGEHLPALGRLLGVNVTGALSPKAPPGVIVDGRVGYRVEAVTKRPGGTMVHNLEVEGPNSYVLAGHVGVHNCHPVTKCPYKVARDAAVVSPLACANVAFFLTITNGAGNRFSGRHLVIADECDTLEFSLLSHVELSISARMHLGLGLNFDFEHPPALLEWASATALPTIQEELERLRPQVRLSENRVLRRRVRRLDQLATQLGSIIEGRERWVHVPDRTNRIVYRPVQVHQFGEDLLWPHGLLWLCMSATVLDAKEMAASLGVPDDRSVAFVQMDSHLEPRRRLIVAAPIANNVSKNQDVARPRIADAVTTLVQYHARERILIHSVSFEFGEFLAKVVGRTTRKVYHYRSGMSAAVRERLIEEYRQSSPPGVLIGPGFERGLDLPDEATRIIVIPKVPYPSTVDPQVAARMRLRMVPDGEDGERWYLLQTIRALIQASGRATRHEDDWSLCYVLDSQFVERMMRQRPRWRSDWLVWRDVVPTWWVRAVYWRAVGLSWLVELGSPLLSEPEPLFVGEEIRG